MPTDNQMQAIIDQLCHSKVRELIALGYTDIDKEQIWSVVSSRYPDGQLPALHQLVNDILSLRPNDIMNHLLKEMYKQS